MLIAFERMDELLKMEEIQPYYIAPKGDDIAVQFDHVTAGWDADNVEVIHFERF